MRNQTQNRIGQQFANYRLIRLLGEGGFAEVYLGEHIHLHTLVAIKVLHPGIISREQDDFVQEARTLAALDHPSIIRISDCGIEHGEPFLIMAYAPNGTLRQRYPKGTQVPPSTVLANVTQVAAGLAYAHERKLVHRDMKPENLLLGGKQEVLISDFGIALITSSSTSQSTKEAAGTVSYMAPEQILGKPRPASDQYALAVIVYEWLSGKLPFRGSMAELYGQHLHALAPLVTEKNPTLPRAVATVVAKALAKEPAQRFPTILEFALALEESLHPLHSASPTYDDGGNTPTLLKAALPLSVNEADTPTFIRPLTESSPQRDTPVFSSSAPHSGANVPIPASFSEQATLLQNNTSLLPQTSASETSPNTSSRFPLLAPSGNMSPSNQTNQREAAPAPPVAGYQTQTPVPASASSTTRKNRMFLLIGLALLVILLLVSPLLYNSLPFSSRGTTDTLLSSQATTSQQPGSSPAATSTQSSPTPQATSVPTQGVTQPAALPVQRMLSSTKTQSHTTNTTGTQTKPGVQAHGTVTFHNYNETRTFSFAKGTEFHNDHSTPAIQITIDADVTVPMADQTSISRIDISAHVVQVGTIGNFPTASAYQSFDHCELVCTRGVTNAGWEIIDDGDFAGGNEPQTVQVVQQSDVDTAAPPLKTSTTEAAHTDLNTQLYAQEHLVDAPTCASQTSSTPGVGGEATSVVVTVSTTCTATAST